MPDLATDRPAGGGRWGWAAVAVAVTSGLMVVGVISPVLPLHQRRDGFGDVAATAAFGCCAVGVMTGLQLTGRFTDARGPRPVLVTALVLAAAALGVLLLSSSLTALVVERVLSGLAAGTIDQAGASTVLRLLDGEAGRASATTATLANVGLGLGPVLGGVLVVAGGSLSTSLLVLAPLVLLGLALQRAAPSGGSGAPVTLRPIGLLLPERDRARVVVGLFAA